MQCFNCSNYFADLLDLSYHFRNFHGLATRGSELRCMFNNCPRVFLSFSKLKKHFEQHHFVVPDQTLGYNNNRSCSNNLRSKSQEDAFDTNFPSDPHEDCNNATIVNSSSITRDIIEVCFMKFVSEITTKPNITLANSHYYGKCVWPTK